MSTIEVSDLPWLARTRSAAERLWDQVDRMVLRFQGRVDTPGYDRGLPYAFALLHAAILITTVLARHHSLLLGAETAKYAQATWQIGEGLRPVTTLAGGNLVAEQGSVILYPLGLITAVLPGTETLLVLKSLALAITIIPLWRLARRHAQLGLGATAMVAFVYSIYTSVHHMNAADFAPAMLAVPALAWAVLYGLDARDRLFIPAIVFALCCRCDLGLAVAGLGILLMLERRPRQGRIALLLGAGWFLLSMYGLQRALADGTYSFLEPYFAFGETPLRALGGIIGHPIQFASAVGERDNFLVVVSLLAPVLFLPLTAPRFLMPAVPLYVLYMGADVPSGRLSEAAQTVPVTVFVFVATIFALQRTGRILVKRVRVERRIILALMLTALIFFIRDSPTSPYSNPWQWGERDLADQARLDAVAELPGVDEPVRASSSMLPLLSERLGVYALDTVTPETLDDKIAAAVRDVDWLLLDRNDETLTPDEVDDFRARIRLLGWEVLVRDNEAGIEVFEFTGVVTVGVLPVLEDEPAPGAGG